MEKLPVLDYLLKEISEEENDIKQKEARLSRMKNQVEELDLEIGFHMQIVDVLERKAEKLAKENNIDLKEYTALNTTSEVTSRSSIRRRRGISIADEVYTFLKNTSEPLHLQEIVNRLLKENKTRTRAKQPMASVASALSRDHRFESDGRGFWSLKVKDSKQANNVKKDIQTSNKVNLQDNDTEVQNDTHSDAGLTS